MLPFNKNLKPLARTLRSNMTDAEKLFWSKVRRKQIGCLHFYRQKNIGPYIVDFYCPAAKLIVEIDGGQHYQTDEMEKDNVRDRYLEKQGLTVIRFSNLDVLQNVDGVLERMREYLKSPLTPL